jgi:hypothetical protein
LQRLNGLGYLEKLILDPTEIGRELSTQRDLNFVSRVCCTLHFSSCLSKNHILTLKGSHKYPTSLNFVQFNFRNNVHRSFGLNVSAIGYPWKKIMTFSYHSTKSHDFLQIDGVVRRLQK